MFFVLDFIQGICQLIVFQAVAVGFFFRLFLVFIDPDLLVDFFDVGNVLFQFSGAFILEIFSCFPGSQAVLFRLFQSCFGLVEGNLGFCQDPVVIGFVFPFPLVLSVFSQDGLLLFDQVAGTDGSFRQVRVAGHVLGCLFLHIPVPADFRPLEVQLLFLFFQGGQLVPYPDDLQ